MTQHLYLGVNTSKYLQLNPRKGKADKRKQVHDTTATDCTQRRDNDPSVGLMSRVAGVILPVARGSRPVLLGIRPMVGVSSPVVGGTMPLEARSSRTYGNFPVNENMQSTEPQRWHQPITDTEKDI